MSNIEVVARLNTLTDDELKARGLKPSTITKVRQKADMAVQKVVDTKEEDYNPEDTSALENDDGGVIKGGERVKDDPNSVGAPTGGDAGFSAAVSSVPTTGGRGADQSIQGQPVQQQSTQPQGQAQVPQAVNNLIDQAPVPQMMQDAARGAAQAGAQFAQDNPQAVEGASRGVEAAVNATFPGAGTFLRGQVERIDKTNKQDKAAQESLKMQQKIEDEMRAEEIRLGLEEGEFSALLNADDPEAAIAAATARNEKELKANLGQIAVTRSHQNAVQNELASKMQELDNQMQALSNRKIDPHRFYTSRTTGQKVMLGIAIGLGSVSKNGVNPALQMIRQAVKNDVDAQKAELQAEMQGLRVKGAQLGKQIKTAQNAPVNVRLKMARIQKIGATIEMVKRQMARPGGEQHQPTLIGLQQDLAQEMASLEDAVHQGRGSLTDNAINSSGSPDQWKAYFSEDQRERYVPGYGIATAGRPEDVSKVRESMGDANKVQNVLTALEDAYKKHGKFSIEGFQEGNILVKTAVGQLRLPLTGPGPLTDTEFQRLMGVIGNPFNPMSLPSFELNKLKVMKRTLEGFKKAELSKVGLRNNTDFRTRLER